MDYNDMLSQNLGVLTQNQMDVLFETKIAIIGLGGLGGHVANLFVRLGLRKLVLIDYDDFSISNLNRQLFSTIANIGKSKVEVVKNALLEINPSLDIDIHKDDIRNIDKERLLDVKYIVDCVDNLETKLYLEQYAQLHQLPLLHGACGGWYGQVGWIIPGDPVLVKLYQNQQKGLEKDLLSPTFIPANVASMMISEFIKRVFYSSTRKSVLYFIDLRNNEIVKMIGSVRNG